MSLQSNVDLRLLNGPLPVNSVFLSFQFVILHWLISVYTHFYLLFFWGHPRSWLSGKLYSNTSLTVLLLPILSTWPININRIIRTKESIPNYSKSCIKSLIYCFLQFHWFLWGSLLIKNIFYGVIRDASGSREETPGKFWNVVLEKDREDQLNRLCEKWRSVVSSQWAEENPTCNKKTEG